jgi:predicted nucleotidyltransferase
MERDKLLQVLKEYTISHSQKYGILSLGVFGSAARNQASRLSDVDIVVTLQTPDPFILVHIKDELENALHLPVDIVRYRETMNPFLKERIKKEGIYVR